DVTRCGGRGGEEMLWVAKHICSSVCNSTKKQHNHANATKGGAIGPLTHNLHAGTKKIVMPQRRDHIIKQARERIARVRASLDAMDYLCSGTLLRRMKMCGKWLPLRRGPRRTSRPVLRMGTHERG